MTDVEKTMLIETEQRSKSNCHRLEDLETDLKEVKNEQKAIYKLATSVEVMAEKMTNIENNLCETNSQLNTLTKAWQETERKLTETKNEPYKRKADNINSIWIAVITGVCTFLATGIVSAIIMLIH